MRRVSLWLIGLIPVLAATACAGGVAGSAVTVSHASQDHPGIAGWRVYVPPGWHAVRFSDSTGGVRSAGIQISNVALPAPRLLPGYPIQVNAAVLAPRGVGLIIATDSDRDLPRSTVVAPPLPLPWPDGSRGWTVASMPAPSPVFETLWFRVSHTMYIAAAKVGRKASKADQKALGQIVRSIRPSQATGSETGPPRPSRHAIVAGVAAHCAGPPQAALLPVTMTARSHGHTVAREVVRYRKDRDRYRLSLHPGRYVISARGSADPPRAVNLHPGERLVVNFPDLCS
jgi:hypothetical protein